MNTRGRQAPGRASAIWIACGLALGPAVGLGLARFAYALLLPAMRADLHWSYAEAGSMNTGNALGYLAGAMLIPWAARNVGVRRTFLLGLAVALLTLPASAISGNFAFLMSLRVVAGVAGAFTFVCGASLASQVASDAHRVAPAMVLAAYFSGPGQGVVLSSIGIPYLLGAGYHDGWRLGWLALGGVGLLASGFAVAAALRAGEPPSRAPEGSRPVSLGTLVPVFIAYTLFGFGYIAYMTFIIAFLRGEGTGTGEVSLFWALLGTASVVAVPVWGVVLSRMRSGRGLSLVMAVVSVGALLPLLPGGFGLALLSALVFGGSFLAVVTAVTAMARRALPSHAWSSSIAMLTVAFSLGQCVGPLLAGALSDSASGVQAGLALSVGILLTGSVIALFQREHVYRQP